MDHHDWLDDRGARQQPLRCRSDPGRCRSQGILQLVRHIAMLALAGIFLYYGIDFAKFGFAQNSEMSGINMLSIYISFP